LAATLREQRDHLGVESIGLGEPARGTCELPDLPWIDDGERQPGSGERSGHGDLEAAGRLEHDQRRGERTQSLAEPFETLRVARKAETFSRRP
jgi:hypothetical protein